MKRHESVLTKETLEYLDPKKNQNFVDCTVGLGGHSKEILKLTSPKGKVLAIDQDIESLNEAKKNLKEYENRVIFVNDNFNNLENIAKENNFTEVDGILLDLGLALWHFEAGERGFTFSYDEPLDMRLNNHQIKTAEEVINKYSEKKLSDIMFQYGDVRGNRRIAKKIVDFRKEKPITTTYELIEIIGTKNPKVLAPIWQAIRIEVNQEYENLQLILSQAMEILKPGGKIAVISFHSGEDRIVKNFFKSNKQNLNILTKKPITASSEELAQNSKSRSAKLRVAEII